MQRVELPAEERELSGTGSGCGRVACRAGRSPDVLRRTAFTEMPAEEREQYRPRGWMLPVDPLQVRLKRFKISSTAWGNHDFLGIDVQSTDFLTRLTHGIELL